MLTKGFSGKDPIRTFLVTFFFIQLTLGLEGQGTTTLPEIRNKTVDHSIHIVGAMSNVMHKGELFANIDIDTLPDKENLYGLGPLENLSGEILLLNGHGYQSRVVNDSTMQVQETYAVKAPFFVYTHVDQWQECFLPDSILTVPQLEHFLDQVTQKFPRPFCFRLAASVDSAVIHIVNLPPGTRVSSPEDAHRGQKDFVLRNKTVEMVGFFSKEHQGVFTHHDSFVHIHLITFDRREMGHLTDMKIHPGSARLLLPAL